MKLELLDDKGAFRPFEELKTEIVNIAEKHYNGNVNATCRALRIGRSTFYRRYYGTDSGKGS